MNERLMTVKDVAVYLQYSEVQTRRLIASGEIPSIRIGKKGRAIKVVPEELQKYIQNKLGVKDGRIKERDSV
jgi:excisionase family DNA binding protein